MRMRMLTRTVFPVAFKVYDMDRDGFISNGELYLVLKQMVGNNLKVSPGAVPPDMAQAARAG